MQHTSRQTIRRTRQSLSSRSLLVRAATMMLAIAIVFPVSAARAEPDPGNGSPQDKLDRLGRQAEILTEKYNGQRVALTEARESARAARKRLQQQQRELAALREGVKALAAAEYMNRGLGPEASLLTSDDPQAVLDHATTARHLGAQQAARLREFALAEKQYQQQRAAAKKRAAEIQDILADLEKKKAKIEEMVAEIEAQMGRTLPVAPALPNISIEGKGEAAEAVRHALSQVGKPYQWGAAGPDSYDCSGLVMWAYQQVGIGLPHYTGSQYSAGTKVPSDQLRPGDIVFFYPDLGHNGMYIGGGKMVHAPRTGRNVEVVNMAPYYSSVYVGAVRVVS